MGLRKIISSIKEKYYKWYYRNNKMAFLDVGDIIWARRYDNERQKKYIEEGHDEGPFLIISKDKKNVYGLFCTSKEHDKVKNKNIFFALDRFKYGFNCDSFIKTVKTYIISDYRYKSLMTHLDDEDLNRLRKALYLNKKNIETNLILNKKDMRYNLSCGDIINYKNELYIIMQILDSGYITYRIKVNNVSYTLKINNIGYKIDFDKEISLPLRKYLLISYCNGQELSLLYSLKKKWDKDIKIRNMVTDGKVVKYMDGLYYVYNMDRDNYYVFKIYKGENENSCFTNIKIDGVDYSTQFQKELFSKKMSLEIIVVAKVLEQLAIKEHLNIIAKKKKKEKKRNEKYTSSSRKSKYMIKFKKGGINY